MNNKLELRKNPAPPMVIGIGDKDYPVTKPTLGAVAEQEERLHAAQNEGRGVVKVMMDFVVSCGLPREVVNALDPDELEEVMRFLTPAKK
jgi:hypothetical protein